MTQIKTTHHNTDVIVIGAGVSGLAAAQYLHQKGRRVIVLEARDRMGGRIDSRKLGRDDIRVDMGASFVHGIYDNPIAELVKELGIATVKAESISGVDVNGPIDQDRIDKINENVFGTFFHWSKEHSASTNTPLTTSLATYIFDPISPLYRGLTEEVDKFRASAVCHEWSGWTGAELKNVSLKWWGFERDTVGPDVLVNGGEYYRLVEHLRDAAGEVKIHREVVRISNKPEQGEVEVRVQMPEGSSEIYTAKHVICTLPLGILKSSTNLFEPQLPPRKLHAIEQLGFGLLSKIALRYDKAWWADDPQVRETDVMFILPDSKHPRELLPLNTPYDLAPRGIMVMNLHRLFGQPILLLMLGADLGRYVEGMPEKEAQSWAEGLIYRYITNASFDRDHSTEHPNQTIPQAHRCSECLRTQWANDPYSLGAYTYIPPGGSTPLDMAEFAVPVWDQKLGFAGEHTHQYRYATVHGAYESGLREGKRVDIAMTMEERGE